MEYKEIRKRIKIKKSKENIKSNVYDFDRFSIVEGSNKESIIVDSDVSKEIKNRKWSVDSSGYPVSNINGEVLRLHDVVLSYDHDEKPTGYYVDHVNHDKLDNRRTNLRLVTDKDSATNLGIRNNNTSGYIGVSKIKGTNKYRAYITKNGKQISLGWHNTIDEAIRARKEAEKELGFKTPEGIIKRSKGDK